MKFIDENIIENVIAEIGQDEAAFQSVLKQMEVQQPAVLGYVLSDDTQAFTEEEKEWLLFATLVVFKSVFTERQDSKPVTEQEVILAEEKNWELIQSSNSRIFRDRITVFFDGTDQEDLLAFVEDSLVDDADEPSVTKEGREPLFIMLKTVIDVFTNP